jgi:hypothetical protein
MRVPLAGEACSPVMNRIGMVVSGLAGLPGGKSLLAVPQGPGFNRR